MYELVVTFIPTYLVILLYKTTFWLYVQMKYVVKLKSK